MTDTCYNQIGKFCIEKKADCDSDLFHCELMQRYIREHTQCPSHESRRIEMGIGACDLSTLKRLEDLK